MTWLVYQHVARRSKEGHWFLDGLALREIDTSGSMLLRYAVQSPNAHEVELLVLNQHLIPPSDRSLLCLGTVYRDQCGDLTTIAFWHTGVKWEIESVRLGDVNPREYALLCWN